MTMSAKLSLKILRNAPNTIRLASSRCLSSEVTIPKPPVDQNKLQTHTGQLFGEDDFRNVRFENFKRVVNTKFAIDLVKEDPIIVCDASSVWSSGGGPLGHPKIFINLNKPGVHNCGYSGKRFIKKKYYDPAVHGKALPYSEYEEQIKKSLLE
jgi:NADH dehydrogenase (ubiquinone) Fe-S protein 6